MSGGSLIREARRRAGLTQAELAARVGTTQSAIARLERGRTEPTFERVQEILRACGYELTVKISEIDDSNWSVASTNLQLDPDARVRQNQNALRFIRAGRAAMPARG
jgi:transcriptional regulator with XRE-family HTH domain